MYLHTKFEENRLKTKRARARQSQKDRQTERHTHTHIAFYYIDTLICHPCPDFNSFICHRISSSMVEITKVGRILLAVDAEQLQKYMGQNIKGINIPCDEVLKLSGESEEENPQPGPQLKRKRSQLESDDEEDSLTFKNVKISHTIKKKWTAVQEQALKREFAQFLRDKIYPSSVQIGRAIKQNENLKSRTVPQIRSKNQAMLKRNS